MGVFYEINLIDFLLVTVFLAGGAAYLVGRNLAFTWTPTALLAIYSVLLAAATRFIHFALFHGSLLSLHYFVVDLIVIGALAALGYRLTRAGQMATQYGWLYRRTGPLSWRRRLPDGDGAREGA